MFKQGLEFTFVLIIFRKTFAYLFTKFDEHIPPYIKWDSVVHAQIRVTLISTCLFNNKN